MPCLSQFLAPNRKLLGREDPRFHVTRLIYRIERWSRDIAHATRKASEELTHLIANQRLLCQWIGSLARIARGNSNRSRLNNPWWGSNRAWVEGLVREVVRVSIHLMEVEERDPVGHPVVTINNTRPSTKVKDLPPVPPTTLNPLQLLSFQQTWWTVSKKNFCRHGSHIWSQTTIARSFSTASTACLHSNTHRL